MKNIKLKVLCLLFVFLPTLLIFNFKPICFAKESAYTSVITDLKTDDDFRIYDYPKKEDVNTLELIQIAESNEKELFIYVYQPSEKIVATSINISTGIKENLDYNNYKLELLSQSGPLQKYKVKEFRVIDGDIRYYAFSSIFRNYNEDIDEPLTNGNITNEVALEVGKQYSIYNENGVEYISVVEIELITVTDKYVGFVEYTNGFTLVSSACLSHFIAFNTDKRIDNLYEADVYYTSQDYSYRTKLSPLTGYEKEEHFGKKYENVAKLKYKDKVEHEGHGLFAPTYKWNRIEKVSDFIQNEKINETVYSGAFIDVNYASKITEEGINELKGKKWVLRFVETPFEYVYSNNESSLQSTLIGNETILRLKFETDGKVYNLGVIDNKTSPGKDSINESENIISKNDNFKKILKLVILILIILLAISLIMPAIPYIFKFTRFLIVWPLKKIDQKIEAKKQSEEEEEDSFLKESKKNNNSKT